MASTYRYVPILEFVLNEGRTRGCLGAMLEAVSRRGPASGVGSIERCLNTVFVVDFAPALAALLDAGLDIETTSVRAENSFMIGDSLVEAAFNFDAPACARALQTHFARSNSDLGLNTSSLWFPYPRWRSEGVPASCTSLHAYDPDAFTTDTTDAAERARLALKIEQCAQSLLSLQGDRAAPPGAEAVRAAIAGWDLPTQYEVLASLAGHRGVHWHPLWRAARFGLLRATRALLAAGFNPAWVGSSMHAACRASTPAVADLLFAHAATEATGGDRPPTGSAAAGDAEPQQALSDVSAAALSLAVSRCEQGLPQLLVRGNVAAALALMTARPGRAISSTIWVQAVPYLALQYTIYCRNDPAAAVSFVRACLDAYPASDRGAEFPLRLAHLMRSALMYGNVALAQLCLDHGADIFRTEGHTSYPTLLLGRNISTSVGYSVARMPLPAASLPPGADPAVEAGSAHAIAAGFDAAAARAHAAAADAEEERLLAALLADPSCLTRRVPMTPVNETREHDTCAHRLPVEEHLQWQRWTEGMLPALTLRWVWDRMCERDPERARASFLAPPTSAPQVKPAPRYRKESCRRNHRTPLMSAMELRNARCIRFLAARGAKLQSSTEFFFAAELCKMGWYEHVWALVDTVPVATVAAVGSVATQVTISGLADALTVAVSGSYRRTPHKNAAHRFPRGLMEALAACGAPLPPLTEQTWLSARTGANEIPGESVRMLRWYLEREKRRLDV